MNDFKTLDFDKVKNIISEYSPIQEVKDYINSENIDFNPLIIKRKLDETSEFLNFLKQEKRINFDGIKSPVNILNKAKKNIILSSEEILYFYTFHNHLRRIKKIINNEDSLELIKEYSDSIVIDSNVEGIIESMIDSNGLVKKDATQELNSINKEINNNFSNINIFCGKFVKENSNILQEKNVCERNNRFVFLFKNNYKNKFEGYDYGESGSGQASYIEPSSLVNLNNKRNELEEKRNKEINKILKYLSDLIAGVSDNYINNFEIIVNISTVYSKAYFGYLSDGCIGELGDSLYLENVKHPLIEQNKVISNTYSLDNTKKGIIISGSNTGGKTVSLKVIGLSICMTYLGIPLIAKKATIPLYDKILVDVDSNQSIKDSLSTFSAHLSSINEIINQATTNSIVLIDELISGTDPKEAEAISLSIIEKLLDIGSKIVVTTHYGLVKKFAFDREDLLLSSVEFDNKTLMPTYRYIENSFGDSNAFDIANRYLNSKDVITNARKILEENKTDEEKAFSELSKQMKEVESLKRDMIQRTNEYIEKKEAIDKQMADFAQSVNEKKNEIIEKFNNELLKIKQSINDKINSSTNNKDLINISNKISDIDLIKVKTKEENYKVGDRVRINEIGNPGYIISISGDSVDVDINGLTIKTNINSLSLLPAIVKRNDYIQKEFYDSPREIVVVGQRAEDALRSIEVFLDKALLAKLKKVKIIHGIGTLALKNAIWDYLKKKDFVNKYYTPDFYDGGLATTIVELK